MVNQLRISADYGHQRFDVILLINGVPAAQIEPKTLGINPRRAMEQIVDYNHDPGNGFTRTLLCFVQMFIISNRTDTWYFANNNARHFSFNAAEHFRKDKRQNQLTDDHIKKIVETYQFRREEERYSRRVSMEKIEAEGYNLNISRYVSTSQSEEEIDLKATHARPGRRGEKHQHGQGQAQLIP